MSEQTIACPKCGKTQADFDGFGWQGQCSACRYCNHPSLTGDKCDVCGWNEQTPPPVGAQLVIHLQYEVCDSDLKTCRENWPDDPTSWCGGCRSLAAATLIDQQAERIATLEQERISRCEGCGAVLAGVDECGHTITATDGNGEPYPAPCGPPHLLTASDVEGYLRERDAVEARCKELEQALREVVTNGEWAGGVEWQISTAVYEMAQDALRVQP